MLSFEKYEAKRDQIEQKLMSVDSVTWQNLDEQMEIDFEEHFKFQDLQAEAFASGVIASDVAQRIYVSLGEALSDRNGGWQPAVGLAEKILITKLMAELLAKKLLRA